MRYLFAILVTFSALALADSQWVKLWEGDMMRPPLDSVHAGEEADVSSRVHKGATARVVVRTAMTVEQTHLVAIEVDTFDCANATYTIQTGKAGPGPMIPVKLPGELTVYQFACN